MCREAVEKEFEIQKNLLAAEIAAATALNTSLWNACGTANASFISSVLDNDIVPDILNYIRSQSQTETAAMVTSASLYCDFQTGWRTEQYATSPGSALTSAAHQADIAWAQKVAAARNSYFENLGALTSTFDDTVFNAFESYNSTVLTAETSRAQALFESSKSLALESFALEAEYADKQFETKKKHTTSKLEAELTEMDELADADAESARKTADEYEEITEDDDGDVRRWEIYLANTEIHNNCKYDIKAKKPETVKTADEDNKDEKNDDYVSHQESLLALETSHKTAIAEADESYYTSINTARNEALSTLNAAEHAYNDAVDFLAEQYEAALAIIDAGGDVGAGHFTAAASSSGMANSQAAGAQSAHSGGVIVVDKDLNSNDKAMLDAIRKAENRLQTYKPTKPEMNNNGWYGSAVHKDVSQTMYSKKGWYADIYIEKGTNKVLSIGNPPKGYYPESYNQVDIIKLKRGEKITTGQILQSKAIEDLYEIKTAVDGKLSQSQSKALNDILNFKYKGNSPKNVKVLASDFHWSSKTNTLVKTPNGSVLRNVRVALYALGAFSAYEQFQGIVQANENFNDEMPSILNEINLIKDANQPDNEKNALATMYISGIVKKYDSSIASNIFLYGWFNWALGSSNK